MAKYQIEGTDIAIGDKRFSEGSIVELSDEQIAGIERYLRPVASEAKQPTATKETGKKGKAEETAPQQGDAESTNDVTPEPTK